MILTQKQGRLYCFVAFGFDQKVHRNTQEIRYSYVLSSVLLSEGSFNVYLSQIVRNLTVMIDSSQYVAQEITDCHHIKIQALLLSSKSDYHRN